jgi:transposase
MFRLKNRRTSTLFTTRFKKSTHENSKREQCDWREPCGKSIAQVARELGISDTSIHQWRKELAEHGSEAFPGSGHQTKLGEENRRLKRELERVQQERDILKKQPYQAVTPMSMKMR